MKQQELRILPQLIISNKAMSGGSPTSEIALNIEWAVAQSSSNILKSPLLRDMKTRALVLISYRFSLIMKNYRWLVFIFIILGCRSAADRDRQAVHDLVQDIIAADNRADIVSVISCYHSDTVLLPPGKQQIIGADAIRKNFEAIFSRSVLSLTIKEDELTLSGGYAICIGRTSGKVLSKTDSTTLNVNDKFVMVLQKRDQIWKIKNLIWN